MLPEPGWEVEGQGSVQECLTGNLIGRGALRGPVLELGLLFIRNRLFFIKSVCIFRIIDRRDSMKSTPLLLVRVHTHRTMCNSEWEKL